eukprot:1397906-Pleurochrysis_carterae.AAC.1
MEARVEVSAARGTNCLTTAMSSSAFFAALSHPASAASAPACAASRAATSARSFFCNELISPCASAS